MRFVNTITHFTKFSALKGKLIYPFLALILISSVLTGCASNNGVAAGPASQAIDSRNITGVTITAPLYDEDTVTSLYERSIPAVVEIETIVPAGTTSFGPFQFNEPNMGGQGSGFFIDDGGHILTNNHVVEGAKTVTVILHDGTELEADVVGTDGQNDLALLKVDISSLDNISYLVLGDSDAISPGQMAVAMGSPYGLEGSITVGIVSGVGRSLTGETRRTIVDVIQTDAAINPGNSGGPLLNSSGEVIGINTAIEASSNGIGFAVPINTASSRLPALLEGGEVKSPWMGIQGMTIDHTFAERLDLPVESGIYVTGVFAGSPAEAAGLKESGITAQEQPAAGGDIIIAIDNEPLETIEDLLSYLNGKKPGDKVVLSVLRDDEQVDLTLKLKEWPDETMLTTD
ncbi:MAG: trypsin-like peptidase domain-containing protein [Dehalococcoidia bacterium]